MDIVIKFLESEFEKGSKCKTYPTRKTYFDHAFGAISLAILLCGKDWDEASKYVVLWDEEWRTKFERMLLK